MQLFEEEDQRINSQLVPKNASKDKKDRATVEQVLDPKTRLIVFKLINKNVIEILNGCISTGKEVIQKIKSNLLNLNKGQRISFANPRDRRITSKTSSH